MKGLRQIPLITALLMSSPAFALNCYEPSPGVDELGADYYSLENALDLTGSQEREINSYVKGIKGRWEGSLAFR